MSGADGRVLNVTFHGVGAAPAGVEAGEAAVWVTAGRFGEILDALRVRPEARVTFDDGFVSDVEVALPELAARGMRATFFVVAGWLGAAGRLSAADVRRLAGAGMGIGSHGMRHRAWRGLEGAALAEEIGGARKALEDVVGGPVEEAACPFGSYGRRSLSALRAAGFRAVYTSDRGWARAGAWLQARNTVHAGDDAGTVAGWFAREPVVRRAVRAAKAVVKRVR